MRIFRLLRIKGRSGGEEEIETGVKIINKVGSPEGIRKLKKTDFGQ